MERINSRGNFGDTHFGITASADTLMKDGPLQVKLLKFKKIVEQFKL